MCAYHNFGLKIEFDPLYECSYVLDVKAKSSAAKLFVSLKVTWKAIWLYYKIKIDDHCIFFKLEATTTLVRIRNEGVSEFHITFTVELLLTKKQQRHNTNELALFDPHTKWTGDELPTIDLNCVNTNFRSSNRITVSDDCAQSLVHPNPVKLSPLQDVEDTKFEDICDDDTFDLDIITLSVIATLWSGLDFSEESIPTDMILTVINLITF